MDTDAQLAQFFAGMWPHLDEHARRLVAASKTVELGYGGISRVSRACGVSRVTLSKGVEELRAAPLAPGRIRHEGGGRHALTFNDPGLAPALVGGPPFRLLLPKGGHARLTAVADNFFCAALVCYRDASPKRTMYSDRFPHPSPKPGERVGHPPKFHQRSV